MAIKPKDKQDKPKEEKHAGGRPDKYDETWPDRLPEMFKDGQSVVEVATELKISVASYYNYENQHPEFLEASTYGKQIAQAYLEKMGRENMFDTEVYNAETKISTKKKFNHQLWGRIMGARFASWRESSLLEHSGSVQIIDDIPKKK